MNISFLRGTQLLQEKQVNGRVRIIRHIKLWRTKLYFLGLLLGGILFVFQLWKSFDTIRQHFNFQTLITFSVAVIIVLVAYGLQIFAWTQLMKSCGYSIKLASAAKGYIYSFIPRYIPGTIWGYWSRNEWLLNEFQIPYSTSSMGSVLEIIVGMVTAGLISVYFVQQYVSFERNYVIVTIILIGSIVFGFWLRFAKKLQITPLLIAIFTYLVFWIVYGLSLLWLIRQITHINASYINAISIYSLSWLIGFLFVITPSGLGVREFVLSILLTYQFLLPMDESRFIALSMRFVIYFAELILLFIWVEKKNVFETIKNLAK